MQSGLSTIDMWSRLMFEPVSENLGNCHVWGFPSYVLEPKFQKPGVKNPKWDPSIQRGCNMGFRNIHSTQVGLVLNLLTASISPQYHVMFDYMFSTVASRTSAYSEVLTRMVKKGNKSIQVMLDKEDDPELDDEGFNADYKLRYFIKA